MVQRCFVRAELFWLAISHCLLPVQLPGHAFTDLRLLTDAQRSSILPSDRNVPSALDLQFGNNQDYIRFVLAYLLTEKEIV